MEGTTEPWRSKMDAGRISMAKETGISLYKCDRCGASEYIKDGDPKADSWKSASRVTNDGSQILRFFCAGCSTAYKALTERQDAEFSEFMAAKKEA